MVLKALQKFTSLQAAVWRQHLQSVAQAEVVGKSCVAEARVVCAAAMRVVLACIEQLKLALACRL